MSQEPIYRQEGLSADLFVREIEGGILELTTEADEYTGHIFFDERDALALAKALFTWAGRTMTQEWAVQVYNTVSGWYIYTAWQPDRQPAADAVLRIADAGSVRPANVRIVSRWVSEPKPEEW